MELVTAAATVRCSSDNKTELDDWHRVMSPMARRDLDQMSETASADGSMSNSRSQSFSWHHGFTPSASTASIVDGHLLLPGDAVDSSDHGGRDRHDTVDVPSSSTRTVDTTHGAFNPRLRVALDAARDHTYRLLLRQQQSRTEQRRQAANRTTSTNSADALVPQSSLANNYSSTGEHKSSTLVDADDDNNETKHPNNNGDDVDAATTTAATATSSPVTASAVGVAALTDAFKSAAGKLKTLKKWVPPSSFFPPIRVPEGSGLYPFISTGEFISTMFHS